jgi:hypothetical protein
MELVFAPVRCPGYSRAIGHEDFFEHKGLSRKTRLKFRKIQTFGWQFSLSVRNRRFSAPALRVLGSSRWKRHDVPPERQNIIIIGTATLDQAQQLVESCEHCDSTGAEVPFQPISFVENFSWHALAFNLEELTKSADRTDDVPMNERVLP